MKLGLIALILICGVGVSLADAPLEFPSEEPPAHISRWIGIMWAGAVNHPIVPVYYSVERGMRPAYTIARYVVLTPREYERLSNFIHSYRCSADNIAARPPYTNTVATTEFAQGHFRTICFLPRDPGCDFLLRLASLHGIDWAHKDTWPIFQFEAELGCKGPLTKWH
jgi:hypothetical protein